MTKIKKDEDFNDGYYHLAKDLEMYPEAWCYIVWSHRGPGKTYSALWHSYYKNIPIIYMKRTKDDVQLICKNSSGFDLSPYVPLNRDKGINVKAKLIEKGIGAFYDTNSEGELEGLPLSYVMALNAVKTIKGIELSHCDWILLDEFIPQAGEIVRHDEGDMLLDLYMTVARDRQKRGLKPVKLILFANSEQISTPITNTLEVVDTMAELNASGKSHFYDEERGIMFHHITRKEFPMKESEKVGIFQAMGNTAWGSKAFEGEFTNNDFTNIRKFSLKNSICMIKLHYKNNDIYVYQNPEGYYLFCSSAGKAIHEYDLNLENNQKLFWTEEGIDLRNSCIEGFCKFQKYSMYDLLINYKKVFKL